MIELRKPMQGWFPELNKLWTIRKPNNEFLIGAGLLSDGLVVPLFLTKEDAERMVEYLKQFEIDLDHWQIETLGPSIKAMKEAAKIGAAGFQIQNVSQDENFDRAISDFSEGHILFPFMCRIEELASNSPSVLGSSFLCDEGTYLSAIGEKFFDATSLSQWINWQRMDRASAKLAVNQPLRSHDEGQPFYCLSIEPGSIGVYGALGPKGEDGVEIFQSSALVLFAKDNVLQQFCPPEGYLPIFCSMEAAEEFLNHRLGGAFHILFLNESSTQPNFINHIGLKAQELRPDQKGLSASVVEVNDLPKFLSKLSSQFACPPWFCFVVNPIGHREDMAWGSIPQEPTTNIEMKGVSGVWTLDKDHKYSKKQSVEYFDGQDTFYFNGLGYDFANLEISYAPRPSDLMGAAIDQLSEAEIEDLVGSIINKSWKSADIGENPCPEIFNFEEIESEDYIALSDDKKDLLTTHYKTKMKKWVLRYWQTVDGEKSDVEFFDTFLDLVGYVCELIRIDESVRVSGAFCGPNIGFEGSGSIDLERQTTEKFRRNMIKLGASAILRGYEPQSSLSLMKSANRVLKSIKLAVCGYGADLICSHIENKAITNKDLCDNVGLPPICADQVISGLLATPHGPSFEMLLKLVGQAQIDLLSDDTISFLTTALFNFQNLGKNQNFDYAPVSVQIVKGLEVEVRRLFKAIFFEKGPDTFQMNESNDSRLRSFIEGDSTAVTLGFLINQLRKARNSDLQPLSVIKNQLASVDSLDLCSKKSVSFILKDVLNEYRNGGAHDAAISLQTCELCIENLISSDSASGLIFAFAKASSEIEAKNQKSAGLG